MVILGKGGVLESLGRVEEAQICFEKAKEVEINTGNEELNK